MRIYNYQRLGEAIICNAISNAVIVISKTPTYIHTKFLREQEGCLNFVCGSGLNETIKVFGLEVNAEKLRYMFWEIVE